MLVFNGSLVISITTKGKYRFHAAAMLLFYMLDKKKPLSHEKRGFKLCTMGLLAGL
jgi:hypothetical protein